jgi:aldose sugar dehydrogenase
MAVRFPYGTSVRGIVRLSVGGLCATALLAMAGAAMAQAYAVEVLAEELEHPWSVAFLPDGHMLVTERAGRLRIVDAGGLRPDPVDGLPDIFVSGQAGLFDVLLDPGFADNGILYISFAHGDSDANHTRVIRTRFDGERLHDVEAIFTSQPPKSGDAHYGGRMAWMLDGTLLFGLGDGFYFREAAQKLDSHLAKMIRIHPDGSVPDDNPFVGRDDVLPEIYSYGHRNVQAVVVDDATGVVYAHEHGPRGGDELNIIEPGRNYGWPVITHGRDYSRALITPFTEMPGMEQPLVGWTPSIAPGGMTLYRGELFPEWRDSLFVAALAEKSVRRVPLDRRGGVGEQEKLFEEIDQRMRDVRTGPDGALYLLTDESDGQLLRIAPAPAG